MLRLSLALRLLRLEKMLGAAQRDAMRTCVCVCAQGSGVDIKIYILLARDVDDDGDGVVKSCLGYIRISDTEV